MGGVVLISADDVFDSISDSVRGFIELGCVRLAVELWGRECRRWSVTVSRQGACDEERQQKERLKHGYSCDACLSVLVKASCDRDSEVFAEGLLVE